MVRRDVCGHQKGEVRPAVAFRSQFKDVNYRFLRPLHLTRRLSWVDAPGAVKGRKLSRPYVLHSGMHLCNAFAVKAANHRIPHPYDEV